LTIFQAFTTCISKLSIVVLRIFFSGIKVTSYTFDCFYTCAVAMILLPVYSVSTLNSQHYEMFIQDVDAIATTVKPGLALSLLVGLQHGQKLVKLFK